MINIQREPTIPVSLQRPEIQKYLNDLADYRDRKSHVEPKPPVPYRNWDVLEAFDRCFYHKCYLTEQWFPNSWKMDVEHFIPRSEVPSKTYDWDNLFPCEHDANMVKPRKTPVGGHLNPCIDNPENELKQKLRLDGSSEFEAANPHNVKAVNTAKLLTEIHNGKTSDPSSIKKAECLQYLIEQKRENITILIGQWEKSQDDPSLSSKLKMELSRESAFTMLIRSLNVVKGLPIDFLD